MKKVYRLISPKDIHLRAIKQLVGDNCYSDYFYKLFNDNTIKKHAYFMNNDKIEPVMNIIYVDKYDKKPINSQCVYVDLSFNQFYNQIQKQMKYKSYAELHNK